MSVSFNDRDLHVHFARLIIWLKLLLHQDQLLKDLSWRKKFSTVGGNIEHDCM
jgi:hypothetical protein